MHCDHSSLFFFDVKELNKASLQCVVEVHARSLFEAFNVAFADYKFIIFDNEKRSLDSTCVCVEPDLFVGNVSHD